MGAIQGDVSTVFYIYKRRYSDSAPSDITQREHPLYLEIPKTSPMDGSDFAYATTTGNPQGIGAGVGGLAKAQANADVLQGEQFQATPRLRYGVVQLLGPAMQRARGNKGSFYDLVTRTTDGILDELGANIAFDLFRDGTGLRGQINAITAGVPYTVQNGSSTTTLTGSAITLTRIADVENFKRGMTIVGGTNAQGTVLRGGVCKVKGIARTQLQIIVDDAVGAGLQVGDFLFRDGDPGNCLEGWGACTPIVAPTPGVLFRNVNRYNDLEALAGTRMSQIDKYPEEALGDLAVQLSIIARSVNRAKVYPTDFQAIVKRLGAKVYYEEPGGSADIGFENLLVHTSSGVVKIGADPDAVPGEIRAYRPDAHELRTIDDPVHIIKDDQNRFLRLGNQDGIEVRFRMHGNYLQQDQASHGVSSYMR